MTFAEGTREAQGKEDFKYNGKELDRTHGLNQHDYSARYYDPAYARFIQQQKYIKNTNGEYVKTKSSSESKARVPDLGAKAAVIVGVEVRVDINKVWEALGDLINKK